MRFEENRIILCAQKKGCCPTIHPEADGKFRVTDDFGGSISLTQDEFYMMEKAVKYHKKQAKKIAANI